MKGILEMLLIQPNDRIFVAGARGMAGSAIVRALKRNGYGNPTQGGKVANASAGKSLICSMTETYTAG